MRRPIRLRGEPPPDDAVVVIRGGLHGLEPENIRRTCDGCFGAFGFYGVSVFAALDMPVEDLCRTLDPLTRPGRIRRARCGDLRGAGFPLFDTGARPHFDIVLPDLNGETITRLATCFGPDEPNPAKR